MEPPRWYGVDPFLSYLGNNSGTMRFTLWITCFIIALLCFRFMCMDSHSPSSEWSSARAISRWQYLRESVPEERVPLYIIRAKVKPSFLLVTNQPSNTNHKGWSSHILHKYGVIESEVAAFMRSRLGQESRGSGKIPPTLPEVSTEPSPWKPSKDCDGLVVDMFTGDSNHGFFSLYAAALGCSVYSVPIALEDGHHLNATTILQRFKFSVALNGFQERVKLAPQPITLLAHKNQTTEAAGAALNHNNHNNMQLRNNLRKLLNLGGMVKSDVLLLKLDVHGFEYNVIKASADLFTQHNVENILLKVYTSTSAQGGCFGIAQLLYGWGYEARRLERPWNTLQEDPDLELKVTSPVPRLGLLEWSNTVEPCQRPDGSPCVFDLWFTRQRHSSPNLLSSPAPPPPPTSPSPASNAAPPSSPQTPSSPRRPSSSPPRH
ncbi:hypothetical protein QOT17_011612 [Balamuthia mandrillaris]